MASDHITVCICTFKRPELLLHLLNELQKQKTDQLFSYSVIVVDNDHAQSAKESVLSFKEQSEMHVEYYCEPEQNIALARNKAVENAKGPFIAFIDDDEFPVDEWLLGLYKARVEFDADGVLGPVKPYFEINPPKWIIKGKICERESFSTGTILKSCRQTRTGNVLLLKNIFKNKSDLFNPDFGKTGGEDVDFFRRKIHEGLIFIWCEEAPVYETVPAERLTRTYHLKRALLRGKVATFHTRYFKDKLFSTSKSTIAFLLYTLAMPFFLIMGQHVFMKFMIRNCDHIGKILAELGINVVKEKNF